MVLIGHPTQFIDILKSEKSSKDDGLIQRFLLCAPQPVFPKSKQILDAPVPKASLSCIFMFIKLANKDGLVFTLSKAAEAQFCEYFDDFREVVEQSYQVDSFIRFCLYYFSILCLLFLVCLKLLCVERGLLISCA